MTGAIVKRHRWYTFRRRFADLRLSPILDYSSYWKVAQEKQEPLVFRFLGSLESVTDGETLWMHGNDLTIPVSLKNAVTYLLPAYKGDSVQEMPNIDEETPVRIRWGRVSMLTEGAKVFVGGSLVFQEERWQFVSTKKNPLVVFFYDGPDRLFTTRVIQSCRQQWTYWNAITPYSLIIGALCLILVAFSFLHRPIFRPTVIFSFVSLFIPLYPIIPPCLLFTVVCRRLAMKSRMLKAYNDLVRLHLSGSDQEDELSLRHETFEDSDDPVDSHNHTGPSAGFGMFPNATLKLARQFLFKAYAIEVLTWFLMLTGIGLNIVFFLGIVQVLL
ncbi:MAG: hypothetical protein LBU85_11490 [Treponema sp.]|jgi:hypothetical protein|nr:hypothetical protein [Treponema sp.]